MERKKMSKIKNRWWGRFMRYQREAFDEHMDDQYHYDKYKAENAWEIRDATGTILTGNEIDMLTAWEVNTRTADDFVDNHMKVHPSIKWEKAVDVYNQWLVSSEGDFELVHVLKTHFEDE